MSGKCAWVRMEANSLHQPQGWFFRLYEQQQGWHLQAGGMQAAGSQACHDKVVILQL